MRLRLGFGCACLALALGTLQLGAQITNELADQIPALRPPQVEIPPTSWEQYGAFVMLGGVLVIVMVAAIIWLLLRPKKPPILPLPAIQARQELENLMQQPEEGNVLSQVSQTLRRYMATVLNLPPVEMTTSDFCGAISKDDRLGHTVSAEVTGFLRECDERKFAPPKPAPAIEAVPKAIKLIDAVEARREQLRAEASAASDVVKSTDRPTG